MVRLPLLWCILALVGALSYPVIVENAVSIASVAALCDISFLLSLLTASGPPFLVCYTAIRPRVNVVARLKNLACSAFFDTNDKANKPGLNQLGGERMFPPESCFEKDTRKTILRVGYVLV